MLMTLRNPPAPAQPTTTLPFFPALRPAPRVKLAKTRNAAAEKALPRRPVAALPRLPDASGPTTQAVLAPPQPRRVAGPSHAYATTTQDAEASVTALHETFRAFRTGVRTPWQKLALAAINGMPTPFASAVRQPAPHWSARMVTVFLSERNFERWSLLPGVGARAQALLEDKHGPLVSLDTAQRFAALETELQYSVKPVGTHEERFAALRQQFGSNYYFHGSLLRNWHQILTQGLEPKSGTALQANGAASGGGLYVADTTRLSVAFLGESATRVLGIVEVINHPSVFVDHNARVVPSKALAALRFVAVYENGDFVPLIDSDVLDAHMATQPVA